MNELTFFTIAVILMLITIPILLFINHRGRKTL